MKIWLEESVKKIQSAFVNKQRLSTTFFETLDKHVWDWYLCVSTKEHALDMYGISQSLRGSEMYVRVWFGHNDLGNLKGFLKENALIKSWLRILVRLCLMIVYSCTIGEDSILEIFKWNRGRGRIHDEDDTRVFGRQVNKVPRLAIITRDAQENSESEGKSNDQ